jgi:hypothetical protein
LSARQSDSLAPPQPDPRRLPERQASGPAVLLVRRHICQQSRLERNDLLGSRLGLSFLGGRLVLRGVVAVPYRPRRQRTVVLDWVRSHADSIMTSVSCPRALLCARHCADRGRCAMSALIDKPPPGPQSRPETWRAIRASDLNRTPDYLYHPRCPVGSPNAGFGGCLVELSLVLLGVHFPVQ